MMRVAIIDCGAGNLHSVRKAFASQLPEGAALEVVTEAAALASASHIVLPGVGAFADCMQGLDALPGMRAALETRVLQQETPFLGICVGMQMLFQHGHEFETHAGLGWFQGEVRKIAPADPTLRIPHMGWNRLNSLPPRGRVGEGAVLAPSSQHLADTGRGAPLLASPRGGEGLGRRVLQAAVQPEDYVYFVHSYAATGCNAGEVLATVDYGGEIVAVIGRKNIMATQFHPEKSQTVGLRIIRQFLVQ